MDAHFVLVYSSNVVSVLIHSMLHSIYAKVLLVLAHSFISFSTSLACRALLLGVPIRWLLGGKHGNSYAVLEITTHKLLQQEQ